MWSNFLTSGFHGVSGLDFIILGFATVRLSYMIMWERGPWNLFVRLRTWAGIEHEDGVSVVYPDTFSGRLLQCIYCLSVWVAVLLFLAELVIPWSRIVVAPLGISGLALLIYAWWQREN